MRLTVKTIKAARPGDKPQKLTDEKELYLLGQRQWREILAFEVPAP